MLNVFAIAAAAASMMAAGPLEVDPRIPEYKPTSGVSGTLRSIGSDTLNNVMTLWAEEYKKFYPNVKPEIEGKGSSTAPPALIEGQAQFGPMSRAMKASEIDAFEGKFGYKPTELRTSIDCLAVFVHKDCPLDEISIEQLTQVFSVAGPELTWGDLGLRDAAFRDKPVSLYGRNSASGTYGYFKKVALGDNDYKASVKEQPGSSAVVQGVANDPFGMGYSGLGYKTADVKVLAISEMTGDTAYGATPDNAYDGLYPLARFLYVYVNYDRTRGLDPFRAEFIKLVFSQAGQEAVIKAGYIPITSDIAREELKKIGVKTSF